MKKRCYGILFLCEHLLYRHKTWSYFLFLFELLFTLVLDVSYFYCYCIRTGPYIELLKHFVVLFSLFCLYCLKLGPVCDPDPGNRLAAIFDTTISFGINTVLSYLIWSAASLPCSVLCCKAMQTLHQMQNCAIFMATQFIMKSHFLFKKMFLQSNINSAVSILHPPGCKLQQKTFLKVVLHSQLLT